jgi:biotin carboxylase
VDLVAVQLAIAGGASYYQLRLPAGIASDGVEVIGEPAAQRGIAIQARVNAETFAADGSVAPAAGTLTVFSPPGGPGVRVDTHGRPGLVISPRYDSLLAKVITHVHGSSLPAAVRKTSTALGEFGIEGVRTNISLLRELLSDNEVQSGGVGSSTGSFPNWRPRRRLACPMSVSRRSSSTRARKCCAPIWPAPWLTWRPKASSSAPAPS